MNEKRTVRDLLKRLAPVGLAAGLVFGATQAQAFYGGKSVTAGITAFTADTMAVTADITVDTAITVTVAVTMAAVTGATVAAVTMAVTPIVATLLAAPTPAIRIPYPDSQVPTARITASLDPRRKPTATRRAKSAPAVLTEAAGRG